MTGSIQTGRHPAPERRLHGLSPHRTVISDIVSASLTPVAPWLLQLAQQPAEGINLAFVAEFLAFGEFDEFQSILHLIERFSQRFDDLRHFAYRLADGGIVRLGGARRGDSGLKFLPRRCGSFREFGRTDGWRALRRQ